MIREMETKIFVDESAIVVDGNITGSTSIPNQQAPWVSPKLPDSKSSGFMSNFPRTQSSANDSIKRRSMFVTPKRYSDVEAELVKAVEDISKEKLDEGVLIFFYVCNL